MRHTILRFAFLFLSASLILSLNFNPIASAAEYDEQFPPECKVALRIITSPEYLQKNKAASPELNNLDNDSALNSVAATFKQAVSDADDKEQFCATKVRKNLSYTSAYNFPQQCVEFIPLLRKSFEDRVAIKTDKNNGVQRKMDEAILEMLVLDEIDPPKLIQRCEVGTKVMHVNLKDTHLREKYPLPASCEVFFAEMEKLMTLPAEFETIQRQRVIFAIENKDTPEKLVQICDEISK